MISHNHAGEADLRAEPAVSGAPKSQSQSKLSSGLERSDKKTTPAGSPESPFKAPEIPGPRFTNQNFTGPRSQPPALLAP